MKSTIAAILALTLMLPVVADGQSRRRRSTKKSTTTAKPAPTPAVDPAEVRAGAERVAEQITTLTHFLYVLGGVVKGIEATDQAIQERKASPAVVEENDQIKATVRKSISNVLVGLEEVENEFATKQALRPYYQSIIGLTARSREAERQAAAGQFDAAGRTLLKSVDHLTQVLLAVNAAAT